MSKKKNDFNYHLSDFKMTPEQLQHWIAKRKKCGAHTELNRPCFANMMIDEAILDDLQINGYPELIITDEVLMDIERKNHVAF